jgi:hypothetical protein
MLLMRDTLLLAFHCVSPPLAPFFSFFFFLFSPFFFVSFLHSFMLFIFFSRNQGRREEVKAGGGYF